VVAVNVNDETLELAKRLGAAHTVDASREGPVEVIRGLGGADAAIALAAAPRPFEQAFGTLRRSGPLVFVGFPAGHKIGLSIFETAFRDITVTSSIVGTRVDHAETYELHAAGRTTVMRESRKLGRVNESTDDVLGVQVLARLVVDSR